MYRLLLFQELVTPSITSCPSSSAELLTILELSSIPLASPKSTNLPISAKAKDGDFYTKSPLIPPSNEFPILLAASPTLFNPPLIPSDIPSITFLPRSFAPLNVFLNPVTTVLAAFLTVFVTEVNPPLIPLDTPSITLFA